MLQEFWGNFPNPSNSFTSESDFESGEDPDNESENSDGEGSESAHDVFEDAAGGEIDVVNTEDNIDYSDYDVRKSFSTKFYSEYALTLWPVYVNRGLIEDKNIDDEAYGRQTLVKFL